MRYSNVRSLTTAIVEGPIERHKSGLASRETGDGLTGTYIVGEACTGPNRCRNGRESAVRVHPALTLPPLSPSSYTSVPSGSQ